MEATSASAAGLTINLAGQVALVTGASRGIGQAIAVRLAGCGAKLAVVARSLDGLKGTIEQIQALGGEVEGYAANVADPADVEKVFQEVEARFQRLDILVNNAGITKDGLLLRMENDAWDQVIDTNLKGCFLFTRSASVMMVRQRYGRIINISSVSGIQGNPGQSNYSASKAGMIGFTKTVAREVGARNITVNAIAPGFITTDMTTGLSDKIKEQVKERIPARRFGNPEDIADAVAFLASKNAGFITGQVLTVDGGMTA